MVQASSLSKLNKLGKVQLSKNFYMREFLYSEIAAQYQLSNYPDNPDAAIMAGKQLCENLLEPLDANFGRLVIRSAYRSPEVNDFGNKNRLNCARNERNFGRHIWDYKDSEGNAGATACIVIPWLASQVIKGKEWQSMAWWIHDQLPYSSLYFFNNLAAFNIRWCEIPERRIDSYAPPKGTLTKPGMENWEGDHSRHYSWFPQKIQ